ncbi:MAG: inositol monophosphatase [Verrucomicrobia bacterium]|nr:inositol monophosphatase [Verrucomicrobiota bacterium]
MQASEIKRALGCAVVAAQAAGNLMRENLRAAKRINSATQHDIKLELDVRCQRLIEQRLRAGFPAFSVLGEEGELAERNAPGRWVVDPIDGTVNFSYGVPHACVSIALQRSVQSPKSEVQSPKSKVQSPKFEVQGRASPADAAYQTVVGVVYDPFTEELWTALRGQRARLNGRPIHVSQRTKLRAAIVAVGFAKTRATLEQMLPVFNGLVHRVRKIRIMGAAALSLTYVATGRFDAYLEYGLRLWDIAAGGLILECAGGEFGHRPLPGEHTYEILASNGRLRAELDKAPASRARDRTARR